jgi:hypothetical protein
MTGFDLYWTGGVVKWNSVCRRSVVDGPGDLRWAGLGATDQRVVMNRGSCNGTLYQKAKTTAPRIPTWSPTVVLTRRYLA